MKLSSICRSADPRAFTLIELLIVIAIIAILALIAIPNFLEAQTRSKVARVHADMRSISAAIESYFVDNNAYPICSRDDRERYSRLRYGGFLWIELQPGFSLDNHNIRARAYWLTTPIMYMSSHPPEDPFFPDVDGPMTPNEYKDVSYFYYNFQGAAADADWSSDAGKSTSRPYTRPVVESPSPIMFNGPNGKVINAYWGISSSGPDRSPHLTHFERQSSYDILLDGTVNEYDPSNGTVSEGYIWRLSGQ